MTYARTKLYCLLKRYRAYHNRLTHYLYGYTKLIKEQIMTYARPIYSGLLKILERIITNSHRNYIVQQ